MIALNDSPVTLNQPGPGGASAGFAERLLEVIDSGRPPPPTNWRCWSPCWTYAPGTATPTGGRPRRLHTRDAAAALGGDELLRLGPSM